MGNVKSIYCISSPKVSALFRILETINESQAKLNSEKDNTNSNSLLNESVHGKKVVKTRVNNMDEISIK